MPTPVHLKRLSAGLTPLTSALLLALTACGGSEPETTDQDLDGAAPPADCNDLDATIGPTALEICDGIDNNCNGTIDEGFSPTTYYADADGDTFGSPTSSTLSCAQPAGYVASSTDCDDSNASIKPGGVETLCNGLDEDCSSSTDDSPDLDADGYDICNAGVPGADGNAPDCQDSSALVSPGGLEQCNDLDDNCNGQADENLVQNTYYQDLDADTYGGNTTVSDCAAPSGYVMQSGDCNDNSAQVNPSMDEAIGDGVDSNCNGFSDAIVTAAGTGVAGFGGDGAGALEASFNTPSSVSVDPQGEIYIADTQNHRIRKISVTGVISTVAGTGVAGSLGDNGPAVSAQLNLPSYVNADGTGNIFIADTGNNKIRAISLTSGARIITSAGTGSAGSAGDGGPAQNAQLNAPRAVIADPAGNLYIADTGNHKIRKVAITGRTISTFAGTGTAGYSGDEGPGIAAQLSSPQGLTVDTGGNIVIADTGNHRIRRVNPIKGTIVTIAGTGVQGFGGDYGPAAYAQLNSPADVFSSATTDLFVVDSGNHRVRRITNLNGTISTVAGDGTAGYEGDGYAAAAGSLHSPLGVGLTLEGNLVIADTTNQVLREVIW